MSVAVATGQLRRWLDRVGVPDPDRGQLFLVLSESEEGCGDGATTWYFLQGSRDWHYDNVIYRDSVVVSDVD